VYSQGYTDAALVDFDLELTNPSTIYEQERLDLWEKKNGIARDMKAESLVSHQWIYDNVFNFSNDEIEKIAEEVVEDKKTLYRLASIENEGNDPAQPAQEGQMDSQPGMEDEGGDEKKNVGSDRDHEDRETYGVRDALGKYDYTHSAQRDDSPTKQNYRVSPLALSHFDSMKKHYDNKELRLLNEVEDLENHLKEKPAKSK